MADRLIIFAENARASVRGLTMITPQLFEAFQDPLDDLTYTISYADKLGTDTIISASHTGGGAIVSNFSNTTTQLSFRLKGFGYVDFKSVFAGGDTDQFRICIKSRNPYPESPGWQPIAVPAAHVSTLDPTVNDDSTDNFVAGNLWINSASGNQFTNISNAVGHAIWRHHRRVIAMSSVAIVWPADTNENVLVTATIPANALGTEGSLIASVENTCTNNANAKTVRVRYSGAAGTAHMASNIASVPGRTERVRISNRGLTNSQVGYAFVGFATSGVTAGSTDTTAATTVVISGQKANAGDTGALETYMVELVRPDIGP